MYQNGTLVSGNMDQHLRNTKGSCCRLLWKIDRPDRQGFLEGVAHFLKGGGKTFTCQAAVGWSSRRPGFASGFGFGGFDGDVGV